MIIVNKDRNDAYNTERVTNIYISSDGNTIKVAAGATTRGGILGKYKTSESARSAFGILMKTLDAPNRAVVYMPTDEEAERESKAVSRHHGIKGKKQKGHGGS